MKGKIITIEGTDCSGKETQARKTVERLQLEGYQIQYVCFPNYDTPTGKIVGGPYLGKETICDGYFSEGASHVDPLVASLYYAADRRYNLPEILNYINNGVSVIIDRYCDSNMAHHGGKLKTKEERLVLYEKLCTLEYDILELPKPDEIIFLYVPCDKVKELKEQRQLTEKFDQHEQDPEHLKNAENAYLELAELHNYHTINCLNENDNMRTIDDINEEVYTIVKKTLRKEL